MEGEKLKKISFHNIYSLDSWQKLIAGFLISLFFIHPFALAKGAERLDSQIETKKESITFRATEANVISESNNSLGAWENFLSLLSENTEGEEGAFIVSKKPDNILEKENDGPKEISIQSSDAEGAAEIFEQGPTQNSEGLQSERKIGSDPATTEQETKPVLEEQVLSEENIALPSSEVYEEETTPPTPAETQPSPAQPLPEEEVSGDEQLALSDKLELSKFGSSMDFATGTLLAPQLKVLFDSKKEIKNSRLNISLVDGSGSILSENILELSEPLGKELSVPLADIEATEVVGLKVQLRLEGSRSEDYSSVKIIKIEIQATAEGQQAWAETSDKLLEAIFNDEKVEDKITTPLESYKISTKKFDLDFPGNLKDFLSIKPNFAKNVPALKTYLPGSNPSSLAAQAEKDIVYKNALNDTDFVYKITDKGFKELIVLKSPDSPKNISYAGNYSDFDIEQVSPTQINLYAKGHGGNRLKKYYTLTAPFMSDSAGNTSDKIQIKISGNILTVEPDPAFLQTSSFPVYIDPNIEIMVLNVHSHPVEGQFWDVDFTTLGQADLTISPADQATIEDMEFASLSCDNTKVEPQILQGDVIFYPSWSCEGVGRIRHLDLKTGHHHLVFDFGGEQANAFNAAVSWDGGAGTSNWEDANNWSNDATPTNIDDVVINTTTPININGSTTIQSLTLGNSGGTVAAVLKFNYDAIASGSLTTLQDLTVYSNAVITHASGTSAIVGKVNLTVEGNANITGNINVNHSGYTISEGPGQGTDSSTNGGAGGASHGGLGGTGITGAGGAVYGSTTEPTELGSGGGSHNSNTAGSRGGGAIKMTVTGTTTVSGTITANGQNNSSGCGTFNGGGSGGSIFITTGKLTGSGSIFARGGDGEQCVGWAGGGGGGRIAVYYTTDSSSITYSYYGGSSQSVDLVIYRYGGSGTLFKKAASQTYGNLFLNNNDQGATTEYNFAQTPIGAMTFDSVTVSNSAALYLTASSATTTNLTLSSNGLYKALSGTQLVSSSTTWAGGMISDSGGTFSPIAQSSDLTIPTSSKLIISEANASRSYTNGYINGTLTHSLNRTATSGATSLYKINYTFSGNLTIYSNGSVNVNTRGYNLGVGPGTPTATSSSSGGAGYGGAGGAGASSGGGSVYGSTSTPTDLGSGGGYQSGVRGSEGGGAVFFTVSGTTTVSGSISANGGNNQSNCSTQNGGGSGGSIYLISGYFAGSGSISANGGNGSNCGVSNSGGGGGGRIALHYTLDNSSTTKSVSGGTSDVGGTAGSAGSINTNTNPGLPASLSPAEFVGGGWTASTSPTLAFNLSDSDLSDTVKYQIQIDDSSDYSSPVVDYTSALQAQGSASFTVGQPAGSGSYATGTQSQTLSESSYYWQVKTIDISGGSSSYSQANSGAIAFRLDATPPNPGTLSSSTITSSSVRIVVNGASDSLSGLHTNAYKYYNDTLPTEHGYSSQSFWDSTLLATNTPYTFHSQIRDLALNTATTASITVYSGAAVPTGLSASATSTEALTLSWSNAGNPAGTEYFALNFTSSSTSGWITSTSTVFSGLSCGTNYSLMVKARNAEGVETAYSATTTSSTGLCSAPPEAPTSLGPASTTSGGWLTDNTPTFSFTITDPNATNTLAYTIQVDNNNDFSSPAVDFTSAQQSQGATTFTVGQAAGGGAYSVGNAGQTLSDNATGYYWRVMATDDGNATSSWTTANSGSIAFKLDATAPSFSGLTATSSSPADLTLDASNATDTVSGLATTTYDFYSITFSTSTGATSTTSWLLTGLSTNTPYSYLLSVSDIAGNRATSSTLTFYTLAVLPANVSATSVSETSLYVYWDSNTNPTGTNYYVDNTTSGTNSGWVSTTNATLSGLACGTAYTVRVKAKNGDGVETQYATSTSASTSQCGSSGSSGSSGGGGGGVVLDTPVDQPIVIPSTTPLIYPSTTPDILPTSTLPTQYDPLPPFPNNLSIELTASKDGQNWYENLYEVKINQPVQFRMAVTGNFKHSLNYTFDCTDDGISEKSFSTKGPATIVIATTCSYELAGIYTVSVYGRQGTGFAHDRALVYVETEPPGSSGGGAGGPATSPGSIPPSPVGEISEQNNTIWPSVDLPVAETLQTAYVTLQTQFEKAVKGLSEIAEGIDEVVGSTTEMLNVATKQSAKTFKWVLEKTQSSISELSVSIDKNKAQTSSTAALAIAPAAVAMEYSVSAFGLALQSKSLFDLWLMLLALMHGFFTQLGLRSRRRYWGTVYDSKTKQPLDPAIVELIDQQTGTVVQSSITDLTGRFGFLDKPGTYKILARKTHYTFPSSSITSDTDGMFEKIYHGETLTINESAGLLTPNIPMDPLGFDWNQESKQSRVKFHPFLENSFRFILQGFFWAGFAVVIAFCLLDPDWLSVGFVAAYCVMALLRKFIPHPHLWGQIMRKNGSVEGLYLELTPALMPTIILGKAYSSQNGKFFLKSPKGEYKLHIKEITGKQVTTLASFDVKVGRDGVVNQKLEIL